MLEQSNVTTYREATHIVTIYAVFGALWIYLSDSLLGWLIGDPVIITRVSMYKGWLFIALTSLLLYVLIARYLAGRMQSEAQVRLSEEKFSTIFRTSPDPISISQIPGGKYVEVNESFCAISGFARDEINGNTPLELGLWVNPDDQDRLMLEIGRHGVVRGMEVALRRKDGVVLSGELSARIIDIGGEPSLLCIMRDVTEQKQAAETLRRNEEELRSLLEMLPAGVGLAGNDGYIEYVNRCFIEMFGYSPADIPTVDQWSICAYPDTTYREHLSAEWYGKISEARNSGGMEVAPVEARITCKDGSIRQVIIGTQLTAQRTIVIFTDITERENAQTELVKMQKLESLGVLAGGIAHDFNNILTGILGNVSYARMLLPEEHRAGKALGGAEAAAKRAAELAHQLLTFARGGEPVRRVVSPRVLIEEALGFVLSGSNVKQVVAAESNLHPVYADEGQISQVLNNLIINAVQAMPGGGIVRIDTDNLAVADAMNCAVEPGDYVRISIADEGCGIAPDDLRKIFDPYFTTKSFGNGLGLASVYSIVTRHGGQITVNSEVGKGTVFTLLLPAAVGGQLPEEKSIVVPAASLPGGSSILVLDDEEMIRDLVRAILDSLGYRVTVCANGEQVLQQYKAAMAQGDRYAAVIMDLTIPGGRGGKELAPLLLAMDPEAVLIVSSGYSNDPVMSDYRQFGFSAVLPKPFKADEIATVLAQTIH